MCSSIPSKSRYALKRALRAVTAAAAVVVVVAPKSKVASVLGSTLAAGQAEHPLQTAQEPCSPAHASTSQASSRQRQT